MSFFQKFSLFFLRVTLGWMMLYAGYTQITTPAWSAEGYLKGAKTFVGLYQWLASPGILPVINIINEWGLVLLGVSLVLGIGMRLSTLLGAVLMALYYLAILNFPYPNAHAYLVDEHIIYIGALLVLGNLRADRVWGLGRWFVRMPFFSKYPRLCAWFE